MITKTIHCVACNAKLENLKFDFDDFMGQLDDAGEILQVELLSKFGWCCRLGKYFCAACNDEISRKAKIND